MRIRSAVCKATLGVLTLAVISHFAPLSGPVSQPAAQAQNFGQRTITGRVLDGNDQPVKGVTVFLRDLKTKAIRSYNTDETGHYRFTGAAIADDHELWAEKDGKKSAVKTISTWDTRKSLDAEIRLK